MHISILYFKLNHRKLAVSCNWLFVVQCNIVPGFYLWHYPTSVKLALKVIRVLSALQCITCSWITSTKPSDACMLARTRQPGNVMLRECLEHGINTDMSRFSSNSHIQKTVCKKSPSWFDKWSQTRAKLQWIQIRRLQYSQVCSCQNAGELLCKVCHFCHGIDPAVC